MRTVVLLILLCIIANSTSAQNKLVDRKFQPRMNKGTIAEFLQDIIKHSGITLEYASGSFEAQKVVQLKGNEHTIADLLQTLLQGQKVRLQELNNKIIIVPSSQPYSIAIPTKKHYALYGYIKEFATNEPLASATIYEPATRRGVVSNNQGYFNFILPEGKHEIEISYGGFIPVTLQLNVTNSTRQDILLSMKKDSLSTVVVAAETPAKDGAVTVSEEKSMSNGLMNEDDPLQFLYLSPGLQNAAYSFSGFQVRGGGTDENLFLLDGNPVYNPTHLLGAISVLNPTVLKSMRFYKSDFPSRLGGSLSSILDINTRQGNMKRWQGELNAGLLAGALTLEGPLVKDKVAIMVSGRKSIPLPFYDSLQDGMKSNFYDIHFRLSAIVGPTNKVAVNFYTGEDQLRQTGKYTGNMHRWGNHVGSVQWNLLLGKKSFINTSVNFSEYHNLASAQYLFYEKEEEEDMEEETDEELSIGTKYISSFSSIKNYNARTEAEVYASKDIKINAGLKLEQSSIKPFEGKISNTEQEDEQGFLAFKPLKYEVLYAYVEPEVKIGRNVFLKPGVRASAYRHEGFNTLAMQPRLYISYRFSTLFKTFASYSRMSQFLHLVINPYAGANRDMWVPSTKNLIPEWSDIFNVGIVFKQKKEWNIAMDVYYKRLTNVTNYANGKSTFINSTDWEQNIESGTGRSYGTELLINRTGEKVSLQGSYALAWSWRQFASINNGKEFPYKYDHRHSANIGILYTLSPRFDLSGLWSFATGNVYTLGGIVFTDSLQTAPTGEELLDAYQFTYNYKENNQFRAKFFQRYDASLTFHSLKEKKLYSSLKIGIYYINGADYQYAYNLRGSLASKNIIVKTSTRTFKLIPYLSYILRF